MEVARPPLQPPGGHRELKVGQGVEDRLDRRHRDHLGRRLGGAGVRPGTPGQVGARAARLPGLLQRRVGVGTREADHDRGAGLHDRAAEVDVLHREVRGVVGDRRVVPQDVVERLLDQHAGAAAGGGLGEQREQGVGDEVALRLDAGAHQHHQLVLELLVGQPRPVLDQPGGHVVARLAPLERDQLHQGGVELLVGAQRLVRVLRLEQRGHRAGQPVADAGRAAEQLVEQQQRKQLGVVVQQVGPAALAELVDEIGGDRLDVPADAGDVQPVQALGDRLAQPQVHGAVGEQAVGPVRHHRQDGAVQGYAALVEVLPAPRVPDEELRALKDAQGGLVPGDQGGVDAGRELDGGGRALGAQLVVDQVRVGREVGAVHRASGGGAGGAGRWLVVHEGVPSGAEKVRGVFRTPG